MCGLVVLAGSKAVSMIPECIERIKHRGPDEQRIYTEENFAIGFQRLAINGDQDEGRQPGQQDGWLSAINGEIYNYQELAEKYQLDRQGCDIGVVFPLYLRLKEDVIEELDGFYSAVFIGPQRSNAICLRDSMGKKPLFVGKSSGQIFIASELKSLKTIEWFESLPKGVSSVDLVTGEIVLLRGFKKKKYHSNIKQALIEAVCKRLPKAEQPVAVFLSGGLDSSLIASITSKFRDDIFYFALGGSATQDVVSARMVSKYLGLKNVIEVPTPELCELPRLISQIVYATESYNPSVISNGLATFLLARAANKAGIKVVLTGEGADELFGGYHDFSEDGPWKETRDRLIGDMTFTELRRLDMACMASSVEPRCPFLDRNLIALSDQMVYEDLYKNGLNKAVLRQVFEGHLPPEILFRKKTSCDVGSGIRGIVVKYLKRNGLSEREELLNIWMQHFKFDPSDAYFHSYPIFDMAINVRGEVHR